MHWGQFGLHFEVRDPNVVSLSLWNGEKLHSHSHNRHCWRLLCCFFLVICLSLSRVLFYAFSMQSSVEFLDLLISNFVSSSAFPGTDSCLEENLLARSSAIWLKICAAAIRTPVLLLTPEIVTFLSLHRCKCSVFLYSCAWIVKSMFSICGCLTLFNYAFWR